MGCLGPANVEANDQEQQNREDLKNAGKEIVDATGQLVKLTGEIAKNTAQQKLNEAQARANNAKNEMMDKVENTKNQIQDNINTQKLQTARKMCNADLICVIDISGSMAGTKLDMVKKSLIILIKLMDENDRLALVLFESDAQILCNLEYMTETKKQEFIFMSKPRGTSGVYSLNGFTLFLLSSKRSFALRK